MTRKSFEIYPFRYVVSNGCYIIKQCRRTRVSVTNILFLYFFSSPSSSSKPFTSLTHTRGSRFITTRIIFNCCFHPSAVSPVFSSSPKKRCFEKRFTYIFRSRARCYWISFIQKITDESTSAVVIETKIGFNPKTTFFTRTTNLRTRLQHYELPRTEWRVFIVFIEPVHR